MDAADRRHLYRDAGVAVGLFAVLLALTRFGFGPAGIPGYVLVLGFDAVQNPLAPGLGGGAFQVALGAYLLGLAGLAGGIAARLRRRFGSGTLRYGLAGAVLAFVLYALVVALAVGVTALPEGWSPVVVAAVVGLGGLWAGTRLASRREPAG